MPFRVRPTPSLIAQALHRVELGSASGRVERCHKANGNTDNRDTRDHPGWITTGNESK